MRGAGETCTEKRNHSTSVENHGVMQKQLRVRLELFVASVLPLVHLLQRATGSRVRQTGSEHGRTAGTFQDDAKTTPMSHSMEGTRVGTRTSRPEPGSWGPAATHPAQWPAGLCPTRVPLILRDGDPPCEGEPWPGGWRDLNDTATVCTTHVHKH